MSYFRDMPSAVCFVTDNIVEDWQYINDEEGHIAYEYEIWHIVDDSPETVFSDSLVDSLKIVPCKKRDFLFMLALAPLGSRLSVPGALSLLLGE